MKTKNLFELSLLLATLAITPAVSRAQDASAPTPTPTAPADGAPPPANHGGPRRGGGYNLKELTAKLNLTADQQKTIGDIIRTARSQSKEVRDDDSLSAEDKRSKMREIFTNEKAQIREALTPEQQATFDAMPPPWGPGGRGGGPGGPPPAAAPTPTPTPAT
jgi:Spy/CpxP family protein refolding chaperone